MKNFLFITINNQPKPNLFNWASSIYYTVYIPSIAICFDFNLTEGIYVHIMVFLHLVNRIFVWMCCLCWWLIQASILFIGLIGILFYFLFFEWMKDLSASDPLFLPIEDYQFLVHLSLCHSCCLLVWGVGRPLCHLWHRVAGQFLLTYNQGVFWEGLTHRGSYPLRSSSYLPWPSNQKELPVSMTSASSCNFYRKWPTYVAKSE